MEREARNEDEVLRRGASSAVVDEAQATLADLVLDLGARAAAWLDAARASARWARRGALRPAPPFALALPRRVCDGLRAGEVLSIHGSRLARFPLARARGLQWVALVRTACGGWLYVEGCDGAPPADERLARASHRIAQRARIGVGARETAPPSAAVAHDLRNQLALAALECRRIAALEHEAERYLEPVEAALGAARELCAALMGSGLALARRVALQPLLERELAVAQRIARGDGDVRVALRCEASLEVELDAAALARCVQNLASNAIEASAPGARVEVEASALPNASLELVLRDRGAGMSADELARSMRAGASGRGGTGYGTASVLACVERLGALLEIESERGIGTRVRLVVPGACGERRAARAVVDPDPRAARSEVEDARAAIVVDGMDALERLLARRAIEGVVARRTLPADERARVAALCRKAGLPYEEQSVALERAGAVGEESARPNGAPPNEATPNEGGAAR